MATKSIIDTVRVDRAGKSHNCQANSTHRINMGDVRLKVKDGLGWAHYCQECAIKIIDRDITKLTQLRHLNPEE